MALFHRHADRWLHREDDGVPRMRLSRVDPVVPDPPGWPEQRARDGFEPHDAETRNLIRVHAELERLEHGNVVSPLIEEWRWRDRMHSPGEKQRFLEPLIARVQRAPGRHDGELVFLLLVCEGVRRSVGKQLLAARAGLEGAGPAPSWHRREEAKRVNEIERERLFEVTRQATLEALYRYPTPLPRQFFGWLRETIAHRTLDFLRGELQEIETATFRSDEAEAMQALLAGVDELEPPPLADTGGLRRWRRRLSVPRLWESVEEYWALDQVRSICRAAIGRLPMRQQQVIDACFYDEREPEHLAERLGISRSTVYNTKAHALNKLRDDDCFFMALCGMRLVRDSARERHLLERYPNGRLPDGRRLVVIDEAA